MELFLNINKTLTSLLYFYGTLPKLPIDKTYISSGQTIHSFSVKQPPGEMTSVTNNLK